MTTPCHRLEGEGLLDPEHAEAARAHIAECPSCRALWETYQRMLGALPEIGASYQRRPDYQARLFAAIQREGKARPRWLWPLGLAVPAIAVAVLVFLVIRGDSDPRQASLHIEVTRGQGPVMRTGMIQPGDRLRIRAETGAAPHHALRVYRNETNVLLECPGDPRCAHHDDTVTATLELDAMGRYQVLWLTSREPLPSSASSLSRDMPAAVDAGADYRLDELEVR